MTAGRLTVLLVLLGAGLGTVFLLPTRGTAEPVGIKLALPQYVGHWYGVDQQVTKRERQILAADTEFARKEYTDGVGDTIFASIVLSGHDLDNSIHRPERCLPAQGWTILNSRKLSIPIPGKKSLRVTRLRNVAPIRTSDGKEGPVYNLNYYWFVGYHHLTASHLEREFMDMRDRFLKGYNQRWAYITVASNITKGIMPFGLSEEQTDKMIQRFIQELFPRLVAPSDGLESAKVSKRQG
jgi:EpsI family protein